MRKHKEKWAGKFKPSNTDVVGLWVYPCKYVNVKSYNYIEWKNKNRTLKLDLGLVHVKKIVCTALLLATNDLSRTNCIFDF